MFVATFLLYGGLYHTTLLLRFLVGRDAIFWSESYVSFLLYPASPKACWYTVLASLNTSSELEIVFNLFWMELGKFFGMQTPSLPLKITNKSSPTASNAELSTKPLTT